MRAKLRLLGRGEDLVCTFEFYGDGKVLVFDDSLTEAEEMVLFSWEENMLIMVGDEEIIQKSVEGIVVEL